VISEWYGEAVVRSVVVLSKQDSGDQSGARVIAT
jgi:hypothetical protein